MKKSLSNKICKLWNDNFVGSYEPTKTIAEAHKSAVENDYSVEIHPSGVNDGHVFFSHEHVTDIVRTFKVSAYIKQDEDHKLYARIY